MACRVLHSQRFDPKLFQSPQVMHRRKNVINFRKVLEFDHCLC
jgi:hypothetical protein